MSFLQLDMVGKVATEVLQVRLQKWERSCAVIIFTVHQLVEKLWEQSSKVFMIFMI